MIIETDNWLLLNTRGRSFRRHADFLANFLKEIERIVAHKGIDPRHEEVVRAKCMEFAERAEHEPVILDSISKIETLEMAAKAQQDYNRKVEQNLTRLKGNLKAISNGT